MSTRHPDRAPAGWSMHDATGVDPRTCVEVAYRMTRLRTEAEHERLARSVAVHARRSSARLWLGRALVTFGRLVEGGGSHEKECHSPIRA
jgi:hypothetical protein